VGTATGMKNITNVPIVRNEKPTNGKKYEKEFQLLQQKFNVHFQDVSKHEAN
jgi:hypothetical protein